MPNDRAETPPLLTGSDVMRLLRTSRSKLKQLGDDGIIPFVRPDGLSRRYKQAAIEAYIEGHPQEGEASE